MFSGFSLANVLGVPIGTTIGQNFGWRASFIFVIIFSSLTFLGVMFFVPNDEKNTAVDLRKEIKMLFSKPVVVSLLTTVFGFCGVFTIFTYITPILVEVSKIKENYIGLILSIFGFGATIGNILGGKFADVNLNKSLIFTLIALTACQLIFGFLANFNILSVIMIFVLGIASFAVCSPFQGMVLTKVDGSPSLVSSVNIGAFNLANGIGAMLGGVALNFGFPLNILPIIASTVTTIGICFAIYSVSLSKKRVLNYI
jgi:DHA1 family inner membrane transport protein